MAFHRTESFGVDFDEIVAWHLDEHQATVVLEGGVLSAVAGEARYGELRRLVEAFQAKVKHASLAEQPKSRPAAKKKTATRA